MILSQGVINKELFARPEDQPERILDMMESFELSGIPVVEKRKFLGVLTKETVLNASDEKGPVSKLPLKLAFMMENTHILDAILFFKIQKLNIIPIINQNHEYSGFMDPISVLAQLDELLVTANPGVIVILQMDIRDYSLARVTHILESNQSRILSSFSRELPEHEQIELSLKIGRENSSRAINALQRHEYKIKNMFHVQESDDSEDLMARYEHLMNCINM